MIGFGQQNNRADASFYQLFTIVVLLLFETEGEAEAKARLLHPKCGNCKLQKIYLRKLSTAAARKRTTTEEPLRCWWSKNRKWQTI